MALLVYNVAKGPMNICGILYDSDKPLKPIIWIGAALRQFAGFHRSLVSGPVFNSFGCSRVWSLGTGNPRLQAEPASARPAIGMFCDRRQQRNERRSIKIGKDDR
jgi:hypothetical protein